MDDKPLRFLFVANTPRDPLAGASGADISLIEALRLLGHEVDEVWADDMPRRIAHPNLHQLLELPRNFARVVEQKCAESIYDVIQVNQPHAWLAAKRHRLSGRPGLFINRSHGWEPAVRQAVEKLGSHSFDKRTGFRKASSRLLAVLLERHNMRVVRWSDGLIVASEIDKQYIQTSTNVAGKCVLALVPGIDQDFLRTPTDDNAKRWNGVLYIGNYCAQKAPELVAEVFREVAERVPDCNLTWITSKQHHGPAAELLGLAAEKVNILDVMSRKELIRQFDEHGIFLLPSHFEGFGLVFLEAMARGMCVVGTEVGGMPTFILHRKTGFTYCVTKKKVMADKIAELLLKKHKPQAIGAAARRSVLKLTWPATAETYIQFCYRMSCARKESGYYAGS